MKTMRRTFSRRRQSAGPYDGNPVANAYLHFVCAAQAPRELSDQDLLRAAGESGAFNFWDDPSEDIYTLEDGEAE